MGADRVSDAISASAGLLGVLVGGLITLFVNRSTQDHQFAEQQRADRAGARVAATIESYRFESFSSALLVLEAHPIGLPVPRAPASSLDAHGLALLLTHLDARRIGDYQHGNFCIRHFSAGYPRHIASAQVAGAYKPLIISTRACMGRTIAALTPLARGAP